jgi:hypothetical protein
MSVFIRLDVDPEEYVNQVAILLPDVPVQKIGPMYSGYEAFMVAQAPDSAAEQIKKLTGPKSQAHILEVDKE